MESTELLSILGRKSKNWCDDGAPVSVGRPGHD